MVENRMVAVLVHSDAGVLPELYGRLLYNRPLCNTVQRSVYTTVGEERLRVLMTRSA